MDDVSSGKYDPLCEHVMDKAKATAALLLIINGDKGHGMSVCINANEELARDIAKKMPELLRHMADMIDHKGEFKFGDSPGSKSWSDITKEKRGDST